MAVDSVWEDGPSRPIFFKRLGNACGGLRLPHSTSHAPDSEATPGNLPCLHLPRQPSGWREESEPL